MLPVMIAIPAAHFLALNWDNVMATVRLLQGTTTIAPESAAGPALTVLTSSQDAEGTTQDDLDLTFLKLLEAWVVERVRARANEYLVSSGQPPSAARLEAESLYVDAGPRRLAIIRLRGDGIREVFITGIVGPELRRVVCMWESEESISVSYGPCGDTIAEFFGARIGGAVHPHTMPVQR